MPDVQLEVNGRRMGEWTSIAISRSVTAIADSFSLGYIDVQTRLDYPIKTGDECKLWMGNSLAVTGYIDIAKWGYAAGNESQGMTHTFEVSGRSKTGDLVKSSAVPSPNTWKEKSFAQIAKDVCDPFGIEVVVTANIDQLMLKPVKRHSVEIGESAADCLGRLAQKLGVLMRTNTLGQLQIGRPPSKPAKSALFLGPTGVKSGSRTSDHRERHGSYIAIGQSQGSQTAFDEAVRKGKRTATDARVDRYTPLVWVQDGTSDEGTLTRAAEWQRNLRAGKSERVNYTIRGWESAPGTLWEPAQTVYVQDEFLRLSRVAMIIESINYTFRRPQGSTGGTEASIDLVLPESLQGVQPPKEPKITDGVMSW